MKKTLLISFLFLQIFQSNSQIINGFGITAGATLANQKFISKSPLAIDNKNYLLGYNGSFFIEYFYHDYFRWVTEVQYNQKGSTDQQTSGKYINKLQYASWNNYLKIRYEMYAIIPYILIGPKLEYNISQDITSSGITNTFLPLHMSAVGGVGVEFVSYWDLKIFIEALYNPDVMPAYQTKSMSIFNKDFEVRMGLKYQIIGRVGACNVPREM